MIEWKAVIGYEGLYEVSNLGNVRRISGYIKTRGNGISYHIGQLLKPIHWEKGYIKYCLTKDGKSKRYFAHRLVAEAFLPNPENKPQVDHINTIKCDNRVENLRWVTAKENTNNPLSIERTRNHIKNTNPFKGKHHNEITKSKISKSNSKEILQIDNNDVIVGIWESVKVASVNLNCSISSISNALTGRSKTSLGYRWVYAKDYFSVQQNHSIFAENLAGTLQV